MLIKSTVKVTNENGPRPAGKPDECFYCKQPIGTNHEEKCVCIQKVVLVKVTLEIPYILSNYWSEPDIDFYFNKSSWCANNIVNYLEVLQNAKSEDSPCLCSGFTGEYLRDVVEEDVEGVDIEYIVQNI